MQNEVIYWLKIARMSKQDYYVESTYTCRLVKQDGSNDEVRHASAGGFDAVVRQASTGGSDVKDLMLPTTTEKAETCPHTSGMSSVSSTVGGLYAETSN